MSTHPQTTHAGMLAPCDWRDFELLDCHEGLKKERWGNVTVARPDPQVIWPSSDAGFLKDCDAVYHRNDRGGGEWDVRRPIPDHWTIRYDKLTFRIKPTGFKHMGLFPEQAVNWRWIMDDIAAAAGQAVRLINLFGYTGGATVAAAAAGASVCHVDAAQGVVNWCRDNLELSGLHDRPVRLIVDDCFGFVKRELRRKREYDAIVMDPPSFGRGKNGEIWKIEGDLYPFLRECRGLLSAHPRFVLVNSYTAHFSPTVLANLLTAALGTGRVEVGELGLPIARDGKILPCGIFGRWQPR